MASYHQNTVLQHEYYKSHNYQLLVAKLPYNIVACQVCNSATIHVAAFFELNEMTLHER